MAVYTEVTDHELNAFLPQYDLGELHAFRGIAEGVENSNYILTTDGGTFILTLYEKRVAAEDLPFFLELMEHLAERGVSCPLPVKARDGEALRRLAGRPAAIVTYLDGVWPRRPKVEHCAALGRALAQLHEAGRDFSGERRNALSIDAWRPLFDGSAERADEVERGLRALVEGELSRLEAEWPRGLPSGVIHADLFPDNVFFLKGDLSGLIDFYFACTDAFAYDVAICLNAWCFEPDGSFNVTKGRALLAGYSEVRTLQTDELDALPTLARGAALRFLLTRLHDWLTIPEGAMVTPKDPREYLKKLRFHARVRDAGEYGLDLRPAA